MEKNKGQGGAWIYAAKFVYTLALAAAIGFGYFYRDAVIDWFKHPTLVPRKAEEAMEAPAKVMPKEKERKIKYWRAPMDPSYISDKPGKSPMGMDLVPVYEDDGNGEGVVKIDPAVVQNIGVRTAVARRMDMAKTIRTVGVVTYDETKLTNIQSKVSGWVEKLYIDSTGLEVSYDTILLEIYSPDLVTTQEEFLLALKYRDTMEKGPDNSIVKGGEMLLDSARRRLELFDVPEHQIKELERDRKVKKTLHIHSPASGVVIQKNVIEGMYVKPGDTLYKIADLRKVWVHVDVFEYEIPYVKIGQRAVMTLSSFPGRKFVGKITYIYPFLETKSRSVKVRLEFDNKDMELKPDMYGEVVIRAATEKNVVAAPSEAIIRTGSRSVVFIDKGSGRFEPRDVTLGMESEGMVAILSGVREGEKVVTSSQFLIDSESKLREAISKMSDEPDQKDGGGMEGAAMDHGEMSGMDMGRPETGGGEMSHPMDHSKMDHGGMDHGDMSHGEKSGHSGMAPGGMEGMDHSSMGHMKH